MTICSFELKFILCYKFGNYYLQFTMNKLSVETELFIIFFKLLSFISSIQLKFNLGKLQCATAVETCICYTLYSYM